MNQQNHRATLAANARFYKQLFTLKMSTVSPAIETICSSFYRIESHLRAMEAALGHKYSPSQPRIPAGQTGGGQWTDGSGGQAKRALKNLLFEKTQRQSSPYITQMDLLKLDQVVHALGVIIIQGTFALANLLMRMVP